MYLEERIEMVTEIAFPKWVIEELEKLRQGESPDCTLDEYLSNFYGQAVHVIAKQG
jgi:hypothetical protein